MAKKPAAKKSAKKSVKKTASKTAKKTGKKPAARKSTASKAAATPATKPKAKPSAKKTASKKPAARKSTAKKTEAMTTTAEPTPKKKPASKKAAPKKSTKKAATTPADTAAPSKPATTKKTARKVAKKTAKKTAASKTTTTKAASDKTASTKAASKKAASTAASKAGAKKTDPKAQAADDKKAGRKGITIVQPAKRPTTRAKAVSKHIPPVRPMLLGPGSKLTKPLIPSGPSAPKPESAAETPKSRRTKSPLNKSKLEKFRQLLLAKRAELLGDVVSMENEALRSESGDLSNTPQHIAEQGSENYDQTLSLNLAAQDRKRIKEIDDALHRIEDGTYGLCELTNQPIPEERLEELPWSRYTIEAARQLERNRGPAS